MENARNIKRYEYYLKNEEKADTTIRKYLHEVEQLLAYMDKADISKAAILQYRGLSMVSFRPFTPIWNL